MPELHDIIYRLRLGQGIRAIQRETGTHRTIIRRMRDVGRKLGWLAPEQNLPTEGEIKSVIETLYPEKKVHPLDVFRDEIRGWLQEQYSIRVIHALLKDRYAGDESTVRRYIRRSFPEKSRRSVMRRDTLAGEIMEVDFGYLGKVYDPAQKRVRKANLFSAKLRHSRHVYREVVYSQQQDVFFACHIHAFEFFGGVPEKVVSDNLKAAVIKASFQDPLVNRTYRSLAEHYGFMISPCLPRRPQHKGAVENDIKYVKNNFWPLFRESQRRLGREFLDGDALKEELDAWSESASRRTIRGVGVPLDIFNSEEQTVLRALPANRWQPVEWGERIVQFDWHVQIGTAYYSAPHRHIGRTVQVCLSADMVRIFHDYEELCTHKRATRKYERVTTRHHGPPEKSAYLDMTRDGLLRKASCLGESVRDVAEVIFADRAVDGLRPVRAMLALSKKYTAARLDAACQRALQHHTPSYRSVKNILAQNLDESDGQSPRLEEQTRFTFARPEGYYVIENHR